MPTLTIGRLAALADVGVETVRFYERKGLIEQPAKPLSGFRKYPETAVKRVRFIQRAKGLGFTLAEVAELLALRVTEDSACTEIRDRAQSKLEDIDRRIEQLIAIRETLADLVVACETARATEPCPVLVSLDSETA